MFLNSILYVLVNRKEMNSQKASRTTENKSKKTNSVSVFVPYIPIYIYSYIKRRIHKIKLN